MIYFDNAATGGFKPSVVTGAAETVMKFLCANPGRSGHRLSLTGAEIVFNARKNLSELFNSSVDGVIFTKNCTEALNTAIFGTVKKGGHVITTVYEHNSVLRPLIKLQSEGTISLDIVSPCENKNILDAIKEKIRQNTYLVVMTSVSNVNGEILPVKEVGEFLYSKNILFLCDGAQGAGHIPIDIKENKISMLALACHKGLYGIMGSGALIINDGIKVNPLIYGGTGTESFNMFQPENYPERLESGTLNLPAIASIKEGASYVKENLTTFSNVLYVLNKTLIDGLNNINKVKCYSTPNSAGIVAFSIDNKESSEVSDILNTEYDIAVRGGLHCAPLMHKYLNTENGGLVRASLAVQNTTREINYFLRAVEKISKD